MSRIGSSLAGKHGARARGASADELRRHNLATILGRLHFNGPASRSELTSRTGLNRSTIADLIGELTDLGLATEGPGSTGSGPGRPSPVVRARAEGAVVLAMELDVDSFAVATIGLGGHVYNKLRVARPRTHREPIDTVRDVARLAGPLLDSLPPGHDLVGIGVGVAGITRRSDGFVHQAPNLGWNDVALGELITSELGGDLPVLVANEADLGAVGEHRRGRGPGTRHLVYISGEVGIGAGVIVDGSLLRGRAGYAGEAGHMIVNPGGQPCRCGSVGCWETEAGEGALLRHLGLARGATGTSTVDAVLRRAARDDAATAQAVDEVGRWLGIGIANLINVFNPELVVLGGLYEKLFPLLEPSMRNAVGAGSLGASQGVVEIVRSALGPDAPLIGAAEAVLRGVLSDPAAGRTPYRPTVSL